MANNYMINHYKGKYRLLPELCLDTNDFPRNEDGSIDEDTGVYISCSNGSKIWYWGLNDSRRGVLGAYIPSLGRGRNIKKAMKKSKIEFFDYDESADEVVFKFLASDIEPVAELLKARTSGASISPFSSRNLPKNNDIKIPDNDMAKYKAVIDDVCSKDISMFKKWNADFLERVLQKKIRKETKNKSYDIKEDMKKMKLGRQLKEFIWVKGYWTQYLDFLKNEIDNLYKGE